MTEMTKGETQSTMSPRSIRTESRRLREILAKRIKRSTHVTCNESVSTLCERVVAFCALATQRTFSGCACASGTLASRHTRYLADALKTCADDMHCGVQLLRISPQPSIVLPGLEQKIRVFVAVSNLCLDALDNMHRLSTECACQVNAPQ